MSDEGAGSLCQAAWIAKVKLSALKVINVAALVHRRGAMLSTLYLLFVEVPLAPGVWAEMAESGLLAMEQPRWMSGR
jgi:hypothetical protein